MKYSNFHNGPELCDELTRTTDRTFQVMQGSGVVLFEPVMTEYRKAKGELRIMMGQLQESRRELERTKELVIRGRGKLFE